VGAFSKGPGCQLRRRAACFSFVRRGDCHRAKEQGAQAISSPPPRRKMEPGKGGDFRGVGGKKGAPGEGGGGTRDAKRKTRSGRKGNKEWGLRGLNGKNRDLVQMTQGITVQRSSKKVGEVKWF